jgi:cyclase
MTTRIALAPGIAALLLAGAALAQDFDKVEIQTTQVAPGLAMLTGQGGNIALSTGADGPILVDDQFAPLAPKIQAAVKAVQDGPIRFVLNTHWHFDHTGGNEVFGKGGALILAHQNVRQRMSTKQFMALMNREVPASPPDALPVVTFDQGVTLHWNGDQIEVSHMPSAHTDGDVAVWFTRANVVHAGDVFVNGFYPFIDTGSGGSLAGVIAGVDAMLARMNAQTKIIPGHGPLAQMPQLKAYRDMLATVQKRVADAIAKGTTLEALSASKPLADLDAEWGDGFIRTDQFLAIVYGDLSRKK